MSKLWGSLHVDGVSFTLGDNGFVFVIGKSGSGKTTLLSLIGGLEEATDGDISVNGKSLKKCKNNDFVNYRNSAIGYVFQDFHLIDELTVKENVELSLNLQNKSDDSAVIKALTDVGLGGYENRFPKELSGGEKQRVAIARALVKNPSVILADEPTGNLDTKTTEQILTLLKKLSETRLVMIVSHNLNDAGKYADRIIELSYGKVINDYVRNPDFCDEAKVLDGKLILPIRSKITEEQQKSINKDLKDGKIREIEQTNNAFIPNKKTCYEEKNTSKFTSSEKKHISLKDAFLLSLKFIKKDAVRLLLYSFITACLIVILGLSELIVTFNASTVIKKELDGANQTVLSLGKNKLVNKDIKVNSNCIINIGDDEIQKFYDGGYSGNVYKMVNLVFDYGPKNSLTHKHEINTFSPTDLYYNGTRGTLVTTEDYVKKLFGKLEFVALADKIENGGVYLTDYSADAMMFYAPHWFPDYNAVLGHNKSAGNNVYGYINGIIKTGYNEKYGEYMKSFVSTEISKEELLDMTSTEEYRNYYDYVIQNLAVSYTFNPDFVKDFVALRSRTSLPVGNSYYSYGGKDYKCTYNWIENAAARYKGAIGESEIVMGASTYNTIFGTNYASATLSSFEPHDVTFKYSYYYDTDSAVTEYVLSAKIVKLVDGNTVYFADNLFAEMLAYNTFTSGLYFDDVSNVTAVMEIADENGFYANSVIALSLATMTKAVTVFKDFFNIIFIGLCVCAFFIIANYGAKLIRDRKYEIGILKALGVRDIDLTFILGLQIVLLLLLTVVLYILGSIVFIDLANEVLIRSLLELAPNSFMMDIKVLYVNPVHFLTNTALTAIIALVSFAVPLVKLRKLKPTNIIKAKE